MEKFSDSWRTLVIADEKYSIRCLERDRSFKIFLTNLHDIWIEYLDENNIIQKCKTLNPSLSIEDMDIVRYIGQLLMDIEKRAVKKSVEHIEFAENLDGGIFKFSIDFEKGSSQQLWEEVTMPLCLLAGELQRRQTILLDLVRKKDEEITEYKLNGAKLTRKYITTEKFDQAVFQRNAPKLDIKHIFESFENVMAMQAEVKDSIKLKPVCLTQENNDVALIKNEVLEDSESTEQRENSSTILENIEDTSNVKIKKIKKPMDDDYGENEAMTRKKSRSAPTESFKKTKNTIHDFIK
ncbi:non-homologous end-joining factor 1 isoform X2 [Venturia canescens]|uniref:non-homologous end-joining factor 1 isoform X2 n=1 Tax=Venturia canescens TaxID=32260 RepID=UPI001C9D4D34|nr:non-homologous end-joining factor 1-like isoform X2 [Venturia canescens]